MKNVIFSGLMLSALTLAACSDDKFVGDNPRDWDSSVEYFSATEDASFHTYYKPEIGRVGDPMPFYDQKAGEFKVLYLQEFNNNDPYCYHPIYAVSTKDGVNYQGLGEVLATGKSKDDFDAALGTGCAIYNDADGLYYIYYTGHAFTGQANREVVMRATSPDFKTWTKDREWLLKGSKDGYSDADFRDPQIFKAEDEKWHMIISSKPKFAEYVSDNLKDWTHVGSTNMFWGRLLECPDVFKMGNIWYLVYSEGERTDWSRKVKYVMADSWKDLKDCISAPHFPNDEKEGILDSRAFYAGKTASDGTNRYIWGWSPYRSGVTDQEKNANVGASGEPNWSGSLVCHKLVQLEDGTLTIGEVPALAAKYDKTVDVKEKQQIDGVKLNSRLGDHNHISFTVKTATDGDRFGVSFGRGNVTKKEIDPVTGEPKDVVEPVSLYYTLVVNPEWENGRRKVNFEKHGPGLKDGESPFIAGADGYIFKRPGDNTYKIDIYTDNSVVVMYINGANGCTQRIYGLQRNCWTIDTYDNPNVTISDVKVTQY